MFTMKKNQPLLRPPSTFSEHWLWFWQYLLSKKETKKMVQNLGQNHPDKCKISCLVGFFNEKQVYTYDHLFNLQKPYWPPCPIVQWWHTALWMEHPPHQHQCQHQHHQDHWCQNCLACNTYTISSLKMFIEFFGGRVWPTTSPKLGEKN